jgi:hypothetical protein
VAAIAGVCFQFIPLARSVSSTSAAAAMPIIDASIGEAARDSGNVSGLAASSSDPSSITAVVVTAANFSDSMSSVVLSPGHHTPCENLAALKAQAGDMKNTLPPQEGPKQRNMLRRSDDVLCYRNTLTDENDDEEEFTLDAADVAEGKGKAAKGRGKAGDDNKDELWLGAVRAAKGKGKGSVDDEDELPLDADYDVKGGKAKGKGKAASCFQHLSALLLCIFPPNTCT